MIDIHTYEHAKRRGRIIPAFVSATSGATRILTYYIPTYVFFSLQDVWPLRIYTNFTGLIPLLSQQKRSD